MDFGHPKGRFFVGEAGRTCHTNLVWDILHTRPKKQLGSLDWEDKWPDIEGFINFTAAHLVTMFHIVKPSKNPISSART